jgi:hypothetical protein
VTRGSLFIISLNIASRTSPVTVSASQRKIKLPSRNKHGGAWREPYRRSGGQRRALKYPDFFRNGTEEGRVIKSNFMYLDEI